MALGLCLTGGLALIVACSRAEPVAPPVAQPPVPVATTPAPSAPSAPAAVPAAPVAAAPAKPSAPASAPIAAKPAGQHPALPELVVPMTSGMQLKGNYTTPADLDQIAKLGVTLVRRGFHWEGIEKEKGVYDFTGNDAVMAELRKRNLRVLGVMAFANKLYGPVYEEPGRAAFARYAAALAAHYKDDGVMWEIWNEPNTMTFWGKHGKKGNSAPYAKEYVDLVKATVPAMRAAVPDCLIVGGSVSNLWSESYKWTEFCGAEGVFGLGLDAWSVHPYGLRRPEDYFAAYEVVRGIMGKYQARDLPLLNSERGFPLGNAEGFAGGAAEKAKTYQARHLVRQHVIDLACGLRMTNWYEWKNAKEGFGIYDGDVASPAYDAYKVMIEQLRGYRPAGRVAGTAAEDYVLAFTTPAGARTLVAWTAQPPGKSPDDTVDHAITLPVAASGTLATVALDGTKGTLKVADGKVTVALTGAPQYLIERAP